MQIAAQSLYLPSEKKTMKNVSELLNAAKMAADLPSDYALAKAIGRKGSHIADLRAGRRWPSRTEVPKLAAMIGMEPAELLMVIECMRSGDPTLIESAQRMLQKLQSFAAGFGGFSMAYQALDVVPMPLHYILC